eukprot:4872206-Amphidinium_carterae.1
MYGAVLLTSVQIYEHSTWLQFSLRLDGTLPGVALAGFWRLEDLIIKWNQITGALPEAWMS